MISKLHHILAFVSCAALAGCALETPAGDEVSTGHADLKKADNNGVESVAARTPCATSDGVTVAPQPVDLIKVIKTDNLLGAPGTDEGPRPHPWQPAPDESSGGTNTGSGTDTSDKPAK